MGVRGVAWNEYGCLPGRGSREGLVITVAAGAEFGDVLKQLGDKLAAEGFC